MNNELIIIADITKNVFYELPEHAKDKPIKIGENFYELVECYKGVSSIELINNIVERQVKEILGEKKCN